jgi:3-hydroxyacyl-CoA dehydrogenase, NAD binding domain
MSITKPIGRVAIIGTGVIGASWAALFLAKGLEVVATDIAPNAEATLKSFIATAWPALKRLGLAPGASQSKLTFTPDVAEAVRGVGLVQENGPERIDFKIKLYAQLDELLPPDVIIASSSSGVTMSEIQSGCRSHPERCVIGHPFNPPHLIPLSRSSAARRRPKRRFSVPYNSMRTWENSRFGCTRNCRGMSPTACRRQLCARFTISFPKVSSALPTPTQR